MSTAGRFKWLAAMVAVMAMMMASAAFAQEKPKIAVYVTSGADKSMAAKTLSSLGAHKTVGDGLAKAIGGVGKCDAVNLTGDITKEYGDAVSEAQAAAIGRQFGVQYLSIVTISNVRGKTFSLGIRLVDAASARPIATASAAVDLGNAPGLLQALAKIALELVNGIATSAVQGVAQGAIGGGAVAASAPMGQQAASGKSARTVAVVYMLGEEPKGAAGAHMVIGEELAKAMSRGGNKVVNSTDDIQKLSAEEQGDTLTKVIGQWFGVPYVCVVEIKEVSGNSYYLNAQMVNTETGETMNTASAASNLSNSGEMADVAQVIARELAGGGAWGETAPQVQDAMPVQQTYETIPAPVQPVYKTKYVWVDEPDGKPKILKNRISVEAGGVFAPYVNESEHYNSYSESRTFLDGGYYIDIDLIYAEINFGGVVNYGIMNIVAKYPIVYETIKVYPLLGVGTIFNDGGLVILGGRIDVGMSEIAYLRSELLLCFGSGSATLFKLGGGFDIPFGESKKAYLRPELFYRWIGASSNDDYHSSAHMLDLRLGIGYKWGGDTRQEIQVEVKPKDESKKWLSAGTGGFGGGYSAGWYMFFDATYAEAYFGVLGGGVTTGAFGKLPFGSDVVKFFPLAGFDYNGWANKAFGVLGAGVDVNVYQDVYVRSEFMYNLGKFSFATFRGGAGYRF